MLDPDPIRAHAPLDPTLPGNRPGALLRRPAVLTVLGVAAIVLGTAILLRSRLPTPPAPAPLTAPAAGPGTPVAGGGVIATLHPAPLAAGRNILVVGVAEPRGTPIHGVTVVTAIPQEMGMGTVASEADERQPGHSTADVSLDMAGRWQVAIQVTRPGGTTATFSDLIALTGDEGTPPADSPSLSRLGRVRKPSGGWRSEPDTGWYAAERRFGEPAAPQPPAAGGSRKSTAEGNVSIGSSSPRSGASPV